MIVFRSAWIYLYHYSLNQYYTYYEELYDYLVYNGEYGF